MQGKDTIDTNETDAGGRSAYLRPRDAAAIVLIDRSAERWRVLMGKRSSRHVFMPEAYVFPGGRCDPGDHALPFSTDLHPVVLEKLRVGPPSGLSAARARAMALASLRELTEETGLVPSGVAPDLSCLRFAVRAVTPPGRVRRYDTRFFVAFTDEAAVDPAMARDSDELHDVRWLDIEGDPSLNIPKITRSVLMDVRTLLTTRPTLSLPDPVPFYRTLHGRAMRSIL